VKVAILMGSASDREMVAAAVPYLEQFGIDYEMEVISAHRDPERLGEYARNLRQRGFFAVIGAAGMANHLAGTLAAKSDLPVIGVPLPGGMLDGLDALLSTVQMPKGVPVAAMSVGKAGVINAAVFAARIAALQDAAVAERLTAFIAAGCRLNESS